MMMIRSVKHSVLPLFALFFMLTGPVLAVDTTAPKGTKQKVQSDDMGQTTRFVDSKGRMVRSIRRDLFGPELGRVTVTDYQYDGQGQLASATVANDMMTRKVTYNRKGQIEKAVQDDLFGVEWGRHREFDDYKYEKDILSSNREVSRLETVIHYYDAKGRIVKSEIDRNTGLGAKRKTTVTITYDKQSGKPASQTATNEYGVTKTLVFDPELLLPARQKAKYNFGLGSTRETTIEYIRDKKTGLPMQRVETNAYGMTRTYYDTSEKGGFGIAIGSESENNFGVKAARKTRTLIKSDPRNGLVKATKADNEYETVWTVYDAFNDGLFGIPQKIETKRKFGLGVNRHTITLVEANPHNGLFKHTKEIKAPDDKKTLKENLNTPNRKKKK